MKNPIQTGLKNREDLWAHITEKTSAGVSQNRADLVQRLNNATPLQGPISRSLSALFHGGCVNLYSHIWNGNSIFSIFYSHSIDSSFTPSLAPFMVPKWLQRFQALYLPTMLFQGDDPSPGSSFRRRGNLVLMTQTTNTWVSSNRLCHISISESLSWLSQKRQGQPKADGLLWGGVDTWGNKSLCIARMLARYLRNECI